MIRYGTNPIAWSNDDDRRLGADISLAQCLDETAAIGFDGIEKGHKLPTTAEGIAAELGRRGLAYVSGWHSLNLLTNDIAAEKAAMKPYLDLLVAVGSKVIITCETSNAIHGADDTGLSAKPVLPTTDWPAFGAGVEALAEFAAGHGVKLVYHHHMGTIVETEAEIDAFMAACGPSVRLLLDTGHASWAGANPVALARRYRNRIGHLHAKDVRPAIMAKAKAHDWSFLDAVLGEGSELGIYTVPGDGMVDYPAVFRELPGYSGWVIVEAEQDPKKAHPLTYARKGVASLRRFLAEAGLT